MRQARGWALANRRDISGNILFEIILMIGIMMVVFPLINRSIRDRADELRNELVIRDMMRIKSAVENFMETKVRTLDFSENPVLEFSGVGLALFEPDGLPKNFRDTSVLNQKYMVKIRKVETGALGTDEYDAIILAIGNPDIPDTRIRRIVKESKGYAGYVEGDTIYGANWNLPRLPWTAGTPLSSEALVFKTNFAKRNYRYISRVNKNAATMHADLYMNGNGLNDVRQLYVQHEAEIGNLNVLDEAEIKISKMSLAGKLSVAGLVRVMQAVVMPAGLISPETGIGEASGVASIFLEQLLSAGGNLTVNDSGTSVLRLVQAGLVGELAGGGLAITVASSFLMPEGIVADVGAVEAESIAIEAGGIPDGIGVMFATLKSLKEPQYRISADGGTATDFRGFDVVVKNINSSLSGRNIGGIDITDRTPLSVILRALQYEYANLYQQIPPRKYPESGSRPVPHWSLPDSYRCLTEKCGVLTPLWDQGM
ncbi:MAG: hypothetical protein LBL52_00515 [Rickettsiales bacterium]|jgi:hypothetical protein|nr:hypothetical protein [Rickettsiales bacterium]